MAAVGPTGFISPSDFIKLWTREHGLYGGTYVWRDIHNRGRLTWRVLSRQNRDSPPFAASACLLRHGRSLPLSRCRRFHFPRRYYRARPAYLDSMVAMRAVTIYFALLVYPPAFTYYRYDVNSKPPVTPYHILCNSGLFYWLATPTVMCLRPCHGVNYHTGGIAATAPGTCRHRAPPCTTTIAIGGGRWHSPKPTVSGCCTGCAGHPTGLLRRDVARRTCRHAFCLPTGACPRRRRFSSPAFIAHTSRCCACDKRTSSVLAWVWVRPYGFFCYCETRHGDAVGGLPTTNAGQPRRARLPYS